MNGYNFSEDIEFSRKSVKAWKDYIEDFSRLYFVNFVDFDKEKDIQMTNMDLAMACKKPISVVSIELKTRRLNYYSYFLNDNKIVVELKGNVENDNTGSGITNCNADLWCYGWFDEKRGILISPMIFSKRKLIEYITNHKELETKTSHTNTKNGKYHTMFALIKLRDIKHCMINNVDDLLEIRK